MGTVQIDAAIFEKLALLKKFDMKEFEKIKKLFALSPFFKQKLHSKLIDKDHYIFLTLNDQLLFCISLMHKRDAKAPIFLKNFLG